MALLLASSVCLAQGQSAGQATGGNRNITVVIPLNNISPALVAELLGGVVIYDNGPAGGGATPGLGSGYGGGQSYGGRGSGSYGSPYGGSSYGRPSYGRGRSSYGGPSYGGYSDQWGPSAGPYYDYGPSPRARPRAAMPY